MKSPYVTKALVNGKWVPYEPIKAANIPCTKVVTIDMRVQLITLLNKLGIGIKR